LVEQTYPNVAPEPSIYWPRVLMTPFGPAPYLMMLTDPVVLLVGRDIGARVVVPKIKPIMTPTAG